MQRDILPYVLFVLLKASFEGSLMAPVAKKVTRWTAKALRYYLYSFFPNISRKQHYMHYTYNFHVVFHMLSHMMIYHRPFHMPIYF